MAGGKPAISHLSHDNLIDELLDTEREIFCVDHVIGPVGFDALQRFVQARQTLLVIQAERDTGTFAEVYDVDQIRPFELATGSRLGVGDPVVDGEFVLQDDIDAAVRQPLVQFRRRPEDFFFISG